MKTVRYYEIGGPYVLRVEEIDIPRPKTGQALIKTEAIGVNYTDVTHRKGANLREPLPFPYMPGVEVAGTVVEAGEGVGNVPVGTRVTALIPHGGYAEYVTVPAVLTIPVPPGLDAVQGLTAYHINATFGRLQPGERILIQAAAERWPFSSPGSWRPGGSHTDARVA